MDHVVDVLLGFRLRLTHFRFRCPFANSGTSEETRTPQKISQACRYAWNLAWRTSVCPGCREPRVGCGLCSCVPACRRLIRHVTLRSAVSAMPVLRPSQWDIAFRRSGMPSREMIRRRPSHHLALKFVAVCLGTSGQTPAPHLTPDH